jgi:anaerobic dimethyl sulfoxide reductase subunit B (iron-sulfur subunit)
MSVQRGFLVDLARCTACKACELACKNRNKLDVGPRLRRVNQLIAGEFPDLKVSNLSIACMHCGNPPCEAVCPTGAIHKRDQDGLVVVDRNKCIGCHYCFFACPFGVPQYATDGKMIKCDGCQEFVEMGKEPACVAVCFSDALHAGTLEELSQIASERASYRLTTSTQPSVLVVE